MPVAAGVGDGPTSDASPSMAAKFSWPDGVVDVQRAAVAVEDEEEVADALEIGGDALLEFGRVGGADEGIEDGVGLVEPAPGEVGLQRQPLVEFPDAGLAALQVERGTEDEHRRREGDGVPEGEPPADGAHAFTTYPTPRTVWISFVPCPESTFFRSRLITTSTMLVPGSKW